MLQKLTISLLACSIAVAPSLASAADKPDKIVVAAYGGVWTESVKKNIIPCFEKKTGVKVEVINGESADWLARIRANPANPPISVVALAEADTFRAAKEGLLDQATVEKVPDLANIPDQFHKPWNDYAIALHFSGLGILYDKTKMEAPKSWKEFIENTISGKYGKRVSMPAGTYTWGPEFMWLIGQQYGGNMDTAFDKMKAASPNVVKFWSTPVEALNLIGTHDVDALVYWDGRANNFIDKGNSSWAAFDLPAPYSIAGSAMIAKVKNSPDVAWEYIACAFSKDVQAGHAKTLMYSVTNDKVVYGDDIKDKMTPISAVRVPPYDQILSQFPAWIERWNKEMR